MQIDEKITNMVNRGFSGISISKGVNTRFYICANKTINVPMKSKNATTFVYLGKCCDSILQGLIDIDEEFV